MHVITVTRRTSARREVIWERWADVPGRTRWDDALEYATIDGPFAPGAIGVAKLKGRPEPSFTVLVCIPLEAYTDRFFLPLRGKMDWAHSIEQLEAGECSVTFAVSVTGPIILRPIVKMFLRQELQRTVDKLVALAEGAEDKANHSPRAPDD